MPDAPSPTPAFSIQQSSLQHFPSRLQHFPSRLQHFPLVVVGLGAMGSSACWHLARRGVRVLGLERFGIPHANGSSHGFSRMIRMAYYEHPDYVPLLRRAYALWAELEAVSGRRLLYETGGLYLGPPGGGLVAGSLASARRHGIAHELLGPGEIARRFPAFQAPDDWAALFEERAGLLLPERAIAAQAEAALRAGAELHGDEPLLEWRCDGGGLTLTTSRGRYLADRIIFCGGAWTDRLVERLGPRLTVTRQVMGWVWPRRPEMFALGRFPVWATDNPDGSIHYGFPMRPGDEAPGLKLAWHGPGPETDPDRVRREPLPGDEESFRAPLTRFLPEGAGPTLAMRTCLYTNSPDHHFIIDRHPTDPRITLACGFSGHGFKFASVVGEILADLATTGTTPLPAQFLGLSRFGESRGEIGHR